MAAPLCITNTFSLPFSFRCRSSLPVGAFASISPSSRPSSWTVAATAASSSTASVYKVTFIAPSGLETVLDVPSDVCIADAAEQAKLDLPLSCRSGNCSSCAALLTSGQVDQTLQTFLLDEQVEEGFVLTCVAYPLSDLVLKTHQEQLLYSSLSSSSLIKEE